MIRNGDAVLITRQESLHQFIANESTQMVAKHPFALHPPILVSDFNDSVWAWGDLIREKVKRRPTI